MDQADDQLRSNPAGTADVQHANANMPELAAELCHRIRAHDRAAEALLVTQLQPGLTLILHRATAGNLELARELCQETLVVIIKRLRSEGLRDPDGIFAYAAQTARNLAIAARRKRARQRTESNLEALDLASDPGPGQTDLIATGKLGLLVQHLLEQLPSERDRAVLKRFYLHEDDKESICRDLSLTELAFNQVLFRARNKFREIVRDKGLTRDDFLDSGAPS